MEKYLKESESLNIPETLEQTFFKDPMLTTDLTATMMLKSKGMIDKTDIKILKFIYSTKFSTQSQVERFGQYIGVDESEMNGRLSILFNNTLINKFGFVDEENYRGVLPSDIKIFYCLHSGGKQILDNLSGEEFIDWQAGFMLQHPKNIQKTVLSAELYLQLYTSKAPLIYHERRPYYTIKDRSFYAGEVFCMSLNGVSQYIVVDELLMSDELNMTKNKLRNYESVFSTNIWKRYYKDIENSDNIPVLIFITDNDDSAKKIAGTIKDFFRFPNGFLISTKERLTRGITSKGSFLRYDKDADTLTACCLDFLV